MAEIMQLAGLTHGGFYAHLDSKQSPIVAAIERMFHRVTGWVEAGLERYGPAKAFELFVDAYLSASHRDSAARGCPIAALAAEIRRQPPAAREAFDRGMERHIGAIAKLLFSKKGKAQVDLAGAIMAEKSGALLLSRCASEGNASQRMLQRARRLVKSRAAE